MNREDSCVVCGKSDQLFRCSRCKSSFYCSKEHQHQHWKFHKNSCQPVNVTLSAGNVESERPQGGIGASGGLKSLSQYQVAGGQVVRPADVRGICQSQYDTAAANSFLTNHNQVHDSLNLAGLSLQSEASGYVYEFAGRTMPPVSVASVADEQQNVLFEEIASVYKQPPFQHSLLQKQSLLDPMKRHTAEWILQVSQFVINDLDKYGICVVDNFLGKERGDVLLKTVQSMYDSGVFQEGEVVSNKVKTSRNIRGDKITWVDGTEPNTSPISYLISMVDSVIMHAKRMKRGKLTQYDIGGRTKAMVACYPGHGTHYVKHVDNPNRDGRCITSIYYLNKDWDIKSDGGLLRIFPEGWSNQVADIEPIFDRMLFFWSDRRNPHEVQPAFRTRYAITLWYFDAKEREEARLRHQKEGSNVVQTKKPAAEDPKD